MNKAFTPKCVFEAHHISLCIEMTLKNWMKPNHVNTYSSLYSFFGLAGWIKKF